MEIDLEILDMLMANASAKTEIGQQELDTNMIQQVQHLLNQVVLQTLTLKVTGSKHLETKYNQYLTQFIRKH